MTDVPSRDNAALRNGVAELCARFGDDYWRRCDQERAYPEEFVRALTEARYLSALIPADYGGLGFGLTEATVILETINRSGGSSSACHAQMYTMGALLRHGSDEQKRRYLPDLATGKLRLQAFSVTEPAAGSNTTAIITFAERTNDGYLVTGHKNWTSRIVESDLLLLLARTRPRSERPFGAHQRTEPVPGGSEGGARTATRDARCRARPHDVQLRYLPGLVQEDARPDRRYRWTRGGGI